jgi:hypothetical protein
MSNLANKFLNELKNEDSKDKSVNTLIEGKAYLILKRYQGNKRVKETIACLLEVADEHLSSISKQEQHKVE